MYCVYMHCVMHVGSISTCNNYFLHAMHNINAILMETKKGVTF